MLKVLYFVFVFALVACSTNGNGTNGEQTEKIVGTWQSPSIEHCDDDWVCMDDCAWFYEFNADSTGMENLYCFGYGLIIQENIAWSINGNSLCLRYENPNRQINCMQFFFMDDGRLMYGESLTRVNGLPNDK